MVSLMGYPQLLDCNLKEGLVFNKNTGNLVGFVELGDVNDAFIQYFNSIRIR